MNVLHAPIGRRLLLFVAVVSSLTAAGCSRKLDKWERQRPNTYKVRGQVLWDGKPEAEVFVTFESRSHNLTAVGITDASGRFALKTFNEGDGAVAGDHAVRLEKTVMVRPPNASPETPSSQVSVSPKKYANTATSGLTATVVEKGPNEVMIEITGPRADP